MNPHDEAFKAHVAAAVGASWPAFAQAHPRLAAALDAVSIGEHVTDSLASDPAFREAYANAHLAGAAAEGAANVVRMFTDRVMAKLGI